MKYAVLIIVAASSLFAGCDNALKTSDFRGGFYTQSGSCTETGDVGISIDGKTLEIGFYCFLKECALLRGKSSQGGFFHMEQPSGHYIQGRMAIQWLPLGIAPRLHNQPLRVCPIGDQKLHSQYYQVSDNFC